MTAKQNVADVPRPATSTAANDNLQPLLLRDSEAAALLGCGRTSIWALIKEGRLETVKVGRLRRITYRSCIRLAHGAS